MQQLNRARQAHQAQAQVEAWQAMGSEVEEASSQAEDEAHY